MTRRSLIAGLILATGSVSGSTASACDRVPVTRVYRQVVRSQVVHTTAPIVVEKHVIVETSPQPVVVEPAVLVATRPSSPAATAAVPTAATTAIRLRPGATYRVAARFLGKDEGEVVVKLGSIMLDCEIIEWSPNQVTIAVPHVAISGGAAGNLTVYRADGQLIKQVNVQVADRIEIAEVIETPSPSNETSSEVTVSSLAAPLGPIVE